MRRSAEWNAYDAASYVCFVVRNGRRVSTNHFFQLRVLPGSGWILCDAILTLMLGGLIAYPWPGSSLWAIGTLVGVNLIISGFTRLMYSVAARSLISSTV